MRLWLVVFVLCVPSVALAQRRTPPAARPQAPAAPAPAPQPAPQAAPAPSAPTASAFATAIATAIRQMVARDFDGAMQQLRTATQQEPQNPQAYYLMGECQRMRGSVLEAVEQYRTAERLAAAANDARIQARALAGVAIALESDPQRHGEAREAWNAYVRFADAHRDSAHPDVGRARIQAIDQQGEQEEVYVQVRQRIAERARAAATPATPARR